MPLAALRIFSPVRETIGPVPMIPFRIAANITPITATLLVTVSLWLTGTDNASAMRVCKLVKVTASHTNQQTAKRVVGHKMTAAIKRHYQAGYRTSPQVGFGSWCVRKRDRKHHCYDNVRMCKTR